MIGTRPRTPPAMSAPAFFTDLARLLNSGQTRAAVLAGNVHDLFPVESGGEGGTDFVPLVPFLLNKTDAPGLVRVVYELNGPVRVAGKDRAELRDAWVRWKAGADTLLLRGLGRKGPNEGELLGREFDDLLHEATGRPTQALEFLRQLTICSRAALSGSLLIFIEAADVLLPAGQGGVSGLPHDQLRRVAIVEDWFCDPAFLNGGDAVVLIADSRGAVHPRVARLPQVLGVEVPAPDAGLRLRYIESFQKDSPKPVRFWAGEEHGPRALADFTAGLNLHALRQLLAGAAHGGEPVEPAGVIGKVEEFIQAQLGEDVIEFKKPAHGLGDVVGFTNLKAFLKTDLIPRFRASGEAALPGAAVAGAIGCHRAGQELLAHDGRRVRVEDVAEGDRLMGPDSCPRTVRRLVRGEGPMVEVVPRKGRPFAVNLDHVLTLKRTRKTNTKTDNLVGEVVDVSVRDYLSWSPTRKGLYKLFFTGVKFRTRLLPVEPYFLGLLIGDGSFVTASPSLTSADVEVLGEAARQAGRFGLRCRLAPDGRNRSVSAFLAGKKKHPNPLTTALRELGLWGHLGKDKFVPHRYLTADTDQRLELLAGLIDSDGDYSESGQFAYATCSERLAGDVAFLCRSLDFRATVAERRTRFSAGAEERRSWRLTISGRLDRVPTRIPRKRASPRRQKKDHRVTGFTVRELGVEPYHGFTLDGDGRYLMDDFTVTHNSGKTFLMEAVASELDLPVLVLKNVRSQWFGQTDVVFEKLRRVLEALQKAVIFVDEADTQFGGVGAGTHDTERRLTGKIQAMMSDPRLRGRILWLLMTARIHLLSPDIRRPGRVGDLIIPVLDPTGADRRAFLEWAAAPALAGDPPEELLNRLDGELSDSASAAAFASLRGDLKARRTMKGGALTEDELFAAVRDRLPPAIEKTRRYQELQALANCTRRSLLPDPDVTDESRAEWELELRALERLGVG